MKKITLAILVAIMYAGISTAQLNLTVQAPVANSNSQLRAPNGTNTQGGLKTCFLIKANELTSLTGSLVNSIGFDLLDGVAGAPVSGNFTLYIQNTNDNTYNKGTSFPSAITGMAVHYTGNYTIPIGVNPGPITLNCTPQFTYNGGGLYVAYEWESSGPFSTNPATYAANLVTGGNLGAASYNTPFPAVNTMTLNDFRPAFFFNIVNTATNEIGVITTDALGKYASYTGTPQIVRALIRNSSTSSLTNVPVTLNVTGKNPFTDTQTVTAIDAGSVQVVTFAAYQSTLAGINNMSISVPADNNNSNNQLVWTQSVTCNVEGVHPPTASWNSSFGYGGTGGSGVFMIQHTPPITTSVSAIHVHVGTATQNSGKSMWGVVAYTTGAIIATTNTITISPGGVNTMSFSPAIALNGNTPYLFGAAQPTAGYYPMAYLTYTQFVPPVYYVMPLAGGTTSLANTPGAFLGIEPVYYFANSGVNATQSSTVSCLKEPFTLMVNSSADNFTWTCTTPGYVPAPGSSTAAVVTPTAFPSSVTPSLALKYTVVGQYTANGCLTDISEQITHLVLPCTGIGENAYGAGISIYPNPAVNGITIISGLEGKSEISVYNMLGQSLLSKKVSADKFELDLSAYPSGNYFIRISDGGSNVKTVKIINQ